MYSKNNKRVWRDVGKILLGNGGEVIANEGDKQEGLDEQREVQKKRGDNVMSFPNLFSTISVHSKDWFILT